MASLRVLGAPAVLAARNARRMRPIRCLSSHSAPALLEMYMGGMASGKTHALLSRVHSFRAVALQSPSDDVGGRALHRFDQVLVIKHSIDTRDPEHVTARTGLRVRADIITNELTSISVPAHGNTLYAIDEAQFFGDSLLKFASTISGTRGAGGLLCAGLDLDFARRPFGAMLQLAHETLTSSSAGRFEFAPLRVERLVAACTKCVRPHAQRPPAAHHHADIAASHCGAVAVYSQRLTGNTGHSNDVILVGGGESYQPACAAHHTPHAITSTAWTTA